MKTFPWAPLLRLAALPAALWLACTGPVAAQEEWFDSPMYRDPDLSPPPTTFFFPDKTREIWLRALKQPSADLRRQAAAAITEARRRGVRGLETTIPALTDALDGKDQHPSVRLAAARALTALDARQAAPALWRQAQAGGIDLREAVEPALARWDHAPARTAWLARLAEPATTARDLALAMRGLAAVREARAAGPLRQIALSDRTPGPARLEAARALALVRSEGLEKAARALAADASPRGLPARLAAAALLARHSSPAAVEALQGLAADREPAVAATAADRLIELGPARSVPATLRDAWLASRDARLRAAGVAALAQTDGPDRLARLGARLGDPHPGVRSQARHALYRLAVKGGLRRGVLEQATAALDAKAWQAQEQAAVLLTDLRHRPAAARLVALLPADRPEVFLAAAWGLRRLSEPSSLSGTLAYLEAEQKRFSRGQALPGRKDTRKEMIDIQLAQLLQLMGTRRYAPAEPVMRRLVPRNDKVWYHEARAAAIWALGLLHEDRADDRLATQLEGRLNDTASMPPEDARVRRMCSVTLGRMRAKAALPSLRAYAPKERYGGDHTGNGCGWAIERITGEVAPEGKPRTVAMRDWFLVPND